MNAAAPVHHGPKIVIIGGGVIGSATAAFLAEGGAAVTVIERDPTYAKASSALSGSSIRQQFSQPVNIRLSQYGLDYIGGADLGLRLPGYLYLAGEAGAPILRENLAIQHEAGAPIQALDPAALAERFPWMVMDGVVLGTHGLGGEGWFDGPGLLQHFRKKARGLGVTYIADSVVGLDMAGNRVTGARLAGGETVTGDIFVNAAGPHARPVAAMAGVVLPVEARRRTIFVFQCKTPIPNCPLVIDTTGVWFRAEGDRFLGGWSPEDDDEQLELDPDYPQWDDVVWPAIAARVPAFEAVKVSSAWAGHYDYNTHDQNGLLGILPDVPNLVFANGFSGHGMQQAPGVGRGIAELILTGGYRSIDLSDLDINRLRDGRQVLERNII